MENIEKKSYRDLLNTTKEKMIELIENVGPDFYEVMHDKKCILKKKELSEMATFISKNCDSFNNDQQSFVYLFTIVVVQYMDMICSQMDFSFHSFYRIIDLLENVQNSKSTFEYFIEYAMKKDKISEKLKRDMYEILKMCNSNYVTNDFREVMHEQVEKWKDKYFENMLVDEDYKELYLKLAYLEKVIKDDNVTYKLKVDNHYKNGGLFKLIRTDRINNNPTRNYDTFEGKLVKFKCNPTVTPNGLMQIYNGGLEEPYEWITSVIIDRKYTKNGFTLITPNTKYHFEFHYV